MDNEESSQFGFSEAELKKVENEVPIVKNETNWTKWFALGMGGLLGASHIGMIGMLANRQTKLPSLNIPVGEYTSYEAHVSQNGYHIEYKANDPKTMLTTEDRNVKGGFLGLANNKVKVVKEYTMDGAIHHGGPVSTKSVWIDPSAQGKGGEISDKTEACIKAIGGGEQSGRLVGTSVGAAAAPALSGIPFVGWLASGWVAMFGGNQGAEIGGNMASSISPDC